VVTPSITIRDRLRVLMGVKNSIVFNDEAHHCYREKPHDPEEVEIQEGETKDEANTEAIENNEAVRLWISGLEIVQKKSIIPFPDQTCTFV
jgi:type III restriction enzyme